MKNGSANDFLSYLPNVDLWVEWNWGGIWEPYTSMKDILIANEIKIYNKNEVCKSQDSMCYKNNNKNLNYKWVIKIW